MGREVERAALERGHEIVHKLDAPEEMEKTLARLSQAEIAIEFTTPDSVIENLKRCIQLGLPVVTGTTGWLDQLPELSRLCQILGGSVFHASNFSIGVNILFRLNRQLAELMNTQPDYRPALEETHHIHKLDSPSGTALTLANDLLSRVDRLKGWQELESAEKAKDEELPIIAKREGEVPGIHELCWKSEIDEIQIRHSAYGRKGFATGAVVAAEWLLGKKGVYTMDDLLS